MGLKDKLKAAMERANAGRQAKLAAKSEVAYEQGNVKKGSKFDQRSKMTALRSENRQQRQDLRSEGKNERKMEKDGMPKKISNKTKRDSSKPITFGYMSKLQNKLTKKQKGGL